MTDLLPQALVMVFEVLLRVTAPRRGQTNCAARPSTVRQCGTTRTSWQDEGCEAQAVLPMSGAAHVREGPLGAQTLSAKRWPQQQASHRRQTEAGLHAGCD